MTDHSLPDDELLSSSLDGELTAEEVAPIDARLAAEPALAERLNALRAAAALAATPVSPLSPENADRMIAAALAASTTTSNVTDLAAASARRRVWPARLATVAAGVIALAIAVPTLRAIDSGNDSSNDAGSADSDESLAFDGGSTDGGDDSQAADVATQESAELDAADDDMADSAAVAADAVGGADNDAQNQFDLRLSALTVSTAEYLSNSGFDPLPADLGEFGTPFDITASLSVEWTQFFSTDGPLSTTTSTDDSSEDDFADGDVMDRAVERLDAIGLAECDDILETIADRLDDSPILAADYATATVAGQPVTVGLFKMPDGQATVVVIDQTTCDVRDELLS